MTMEYEVQGESRSLRVWFAVSWVEYPDKPMHVTGLHVDVVNGGVAFVEVLGRRLLKSGAAGTPCRTVVYNKRDAPEWVRDLIAVAIERYGNPA